VKRDLKDWCVTKELALDRRVEANNSCARTLILGSFLLLLFVKVFSLPLFRFFDLIFYCLFYFFLFDFLSPFVFPLLFRSCFVPFFWLMLFHL
jgi:hypothetical protein